MQEKRDGARERRWGVRWQAEDGDTIVESSRKRSVGKRQTRQRKKKPAVVVFLSVAMLDVVRGDRDRAENGSGSTDHTFPRAHSSWAVNNQGRSS